LLVNVPRQASVTISQILSGAGVPMRFTLAMLSFDGKVMLRDTLHSAGILARRTERRLVRKFGKLLRTRMQRAPRGGHEAHLALDRPRKIRLKVMLPWSFCALCEFHIAGEPAYFFTYLPGFYREMELAPIVVMEQLLQAISHKPVKLSLQSVPERPLMTCIGSPLRNKGDATDLVCWGLSLGPRP
jgi:hypothetical protein